MTDINKNADKSVEKIVEKIVEELEESLEPKRDYIALGSNFKRSKHIILNSFDDVVRLANLAVKAGMFKSSKDDDALASASIVLFKAMELGLKPIQALGSLYVINGKVSIYGDAMLALVRASGLLKNHVETPVRDKNGEIEGYTVKSTRIDNTIVEHTILHKNVINRGAVWEKEPVRMSQMRARSRVLRDLYPDLLEGLYNEGDAFEEQKVVKNESDSVINIVDNAEDVQLEIEDAIAQIEQIKEQNLQQNIENIEEEKVQKCPI